MAQTFNAGSFIGRWFFALILVLGTYNPTTYSYISWVLDKGTHFGPVIALVGLILLIGWVVYIRATFQSMGWLGITLGVAVLGCLVWFMVDQGWFSLESQNAITWIVLIILSLILTVGMSWSLIRRNMTGQVDVDQLNH